LLDAARLTPAIEVSFQDESQRTASSTGPNASWNQLLSLSFYPREGTFSPASLAMVSDVLTFNIFDTTTSGENGKASRDDRWLGSFSVPFSTIYQNGQVDGTFVVT
jgi:coiled-coil and C2 domain-containing protein 2A